MPDLTSLIDRVKAVEGLFVGQLTPDELDAFTQLCRESAARRSYEGSSGFLGLAKVRLTALTDGGHDDNTEARRG